MKVEKRATSELINEYVFGKDLDLCFDVIKELKKRGIDTRKVMKDIDKVIMKYAKGASYEDENKR